jgi:hypothetical protein
MAEAKATDPKPSVRKLAPASESGDPAVHRLLALKQAHQMNGDDDKVKQVDRRLNELGYE